MNYNIDENKIYLSIDKGEKVNATLLKVCEDNNISFGWINGIGAIDNPDVGYYDIKSKNTFRGKIGIFEINDNKINHQLNFYKIDKNGLKKIF